MIGRVIAVCALLNSGTVASLRLAVTAYSVPVPAGSSCAGRGVAHPLARGGGGAGNVVAAVWNPSSESLKAVPSPTAVIVNSYKVFAASPAMLIPLVAFVCGTPTSVAPLARYTRIVYEAAFAMDANDTVTADVDVATTVGTDGLESWGRLATNAIVAVWNGDSSPFLVTETEIVPLPTEAAVYVSVASATLTAACGPEKLIVAPEHVVHGEVDRPALSTTAMVPFVELASIVTSATKPAMYTGVRGRALPTVASTVLGACRSSGTTAVCETELEAMPVPTSFTARSMTSYVAPSTSAVPSDDA